MKNIHSRNVESRQLFNWVRYNEITWRLKDIHGNKDSFLLGFEAWKKQFKHIFANTGYYKRLANLAIYRSIYFYMLTLAILQRIVDL